MIKRVLNNLFKSPVTRLYPYNKRESFDRFRGRLVFNEEDCIYCSMCQRRCPSDAIKVDRQNTTWTLNTLRCIICSECVNVCPKKCLSISNERRAVSTDKEILIYNRQK